MTRSPVPFAPRLLAVCLAVAIGGISVSVFAAPEAGSRAERIAARRIERIEAIERRVKAAAEMPPRPADVRWMLRRGLPLPPVGPAAAQQPPVASPARSPVAPPQPIAQVPAAAPANPPSPEKASVSQATAIDDGTRSVLVREQPTSAPPAELLPTPQAKP